MLMTITNKCRCGLPIILGCLVNDLLENKTVPLNDESLQKVYKLRHSILDLTFTVTTMF